jgi:hypothetical protein
MFGLRKRFKLSLNESSIEKIHATSFKELPVEIYFCIFDHLKANDILKFRLVNSFFKGLIDCALFLWMKRFLIHVSLSKRLDIDRFFKFLEENQSNEIAIDCLNEIKSPNVKCHTLSDQTTLKSIHFYTLNILAFNYFNMFSECCVDLKIDSFVNSFGIVKSLTQSEISNLLLKKYTKLKNLQVSCLLYDKKQGKHFIWNDIYLDDFFQNHFSQLFSNVNELRLTHYTGSNKILIKCLRNFKSLSTIILEECKPINDYLKIKSIKKEKSFEKRIRIESLQMSSVTASMALTVLDKLVDMSHIKHLNFFTKLKPRQRDEENEEEWIQTQLDYVLDTHNKKFSNY